MHSIQKPHLQRECFGNYTAAEFFTDWLLSLSPSRHNAIALKGNVAIKWRNNRDRLNTKHTALNQSTLLPIELHSWPKHMQKSQRSVGSKDRVERNGQTDKNYRFITAFLTVVGNCNERTNWWWSCQSHRCTFPTEVLVDPPSQPAWAAQMGFSMHHKETFPWQAQSSKTIHNIATSKATGDQTSYI